MAKIFWLASYPKSGNTWMRAFLTNYLRDQDVPASINDLTLGPIASSRVCFDEWSGVEASALPKRLIDEVRPRVFRCLQQESGHALYMKVHDAWRKTRAGTVLFPKDVTAGVVYLIRDPRDVAVSCAHHWGVSPAKAVDNLCKKSFAIARSKDGTSNQLRQFLGSWSDHVRSWVEDSGLPLVVLKYEDLLEDPENTFVKVIRFLDLPFDGCRLRKAIGFSSFAVLQRQEFETGFKERSWKASGNFFRRGENGGWKRELSSSLAGKIVSEHAQLMRRFHYLPEPAEARTTRSESCWT